MIRHRVHLSSTILKAHNAAELAHAGTLLDQLERLKNDARRVQEKAEAEGNYHAALAAIRELVRIIDLVARLSGELREGNETNILNVNLSPDTAARMAEMYLRFTGCRTTKHMTKNGWHQGSSRTGIPDSYR